MKRYEPWFGPAPSRENGYRASGVEPGAGFWPSVILAAKACVGMLVGAVCIGLVIEAARQVESWLP